AGDELRNKGAFRAVKHGTYMNLVLRLQHGDGQTLYGVKNEKEGQIAAIIIEPETDIEFLRYCRTICDEIGALLIFDEIITWPRFGLSGAQGLYGVTPDIACVGKAMANGMPISAIVGKRKYFKIMEKISYSGTFFGETLSIAAAIACLEKLEQED